MNPPAIPVDACTLELDAGNTRTKWRWLDAADKTLESGAWVRGASLLPNWPTQPPGKIFRVRVVSVAGRAHDEALCIALAEVGLPTPAFARARTRQGRLVSGYRSPEHLGPDRWVAMLAASDLTETPFLVVDAGSAVTVDVVDGDGCHVGGWIAPGLAMLRRALLSETSGVRFGSHDVARDAPGRSTADAVVGGTLHMIRDFVAARAADAKNSYPALEVFITGGDGALLASAIRGAAEVVPELVLDGLRHAVRD